MSVEGASKALAKRKVCFVKQLGESTSRRDQRNPRKAIQTPQREYDWGVPPENDAASILEFWSTCATLD
ncbi:hypothetical protein N7501_005457 [Penicillium viridicatum]|nr:hypothetical protein N7501_005457 [Penicillium viridicatum]